MQTGTNRHHCHRNVIQTSQKAEPGTPSPRPSPISWKTARRLISALMKGAGLPDGEERVTFQRYNELIGLNEMLADAAAITQKTE